jgi:enamine deaminase RidA (YjgF/YER057c/UK114 family)
MFDYELVVEILDQLDQACNKILSRIENIVNANYFTDTP